MLVEKLVLIESICYAGHGTRLLVVRKMFTGYCLFYFCLGDLNMLYEDVMIVNADNVTLSLEV